MLSTPVFHSGSQSVTGCHSELPEHKVTESQSAPATPVHDSPDTFQLKPLCLTAPPSANTPVSLFTWTQTDPSVLLPAAVVASSSSQAHVKDPSVLLPAAVVASSSSVLLPAAVVASSSSQAHVKDPTSPLSGAGSQAVLAANAFISAKAGGSASTSAAETDTPSFSFPVLHTLPRELVQTLFTPPELVSTCDRCTSTSLDYLAVTSRFMLPPFLRQLYHFYPYHGEGMYVFHQRFMKDIGAGDPSQVLLMIMQGLYRQSVDTRSTRVRQKKGVTTSCSISTQTDELALETDREYIDSVRSAITREASLPTSSNASDAAPRVHGQNASRITALSVPAPSPGEDESGTSQAHTPHTTSSAPAPSSGAEVRSAEADEEEMCVACVTRPRDRVLLPCAHLVLCSLCYRRVTNCPVCRQQVLASVLVVR